MAELQYLYGSGPQDRVFVVETDDDGSTYVRFGDGTIGALLPSGAQVTADYRTGLGTAGNVGAGTLTSPLTRPKGLRSVTNPLAAGGGADAETIDEARLNAPTTVRTFERIVSLRDAEDQARENAMVAKAQRGVDDGRRRPRRCGHRRRRRRCAARPKPARRPARRPRRAPRPQPSDAGTRLQRPLALSIVVRLIAIDADRDPKDVSAAVSAALLAHFSFAVRDFGQPVRLSEVLRRRSGGPRRDRRRRRPPDALPTRRSSPPHGLSTAAVQDRIDLASDELATLDAVNLAVTVAT